MGTTTREEIIALEQKAVDRAYDCYAARLAELTGGSVASASASGKDSVANRLAAEERAAAYGGLGNASLVISRVDVQDGPGGEADTWYVGRRAVSDVRTRDTVVVEWTNALAKQWLDALPDAPGEVLLRRRRLHCTQRVVEGYADDIAVAVAVPAPRPATDDAGPETAAADSTTDSTTDVQQPEKARPAPVLTPADVARLHRQKPQTPDDFLLRELQRSRSGTMRDIVETIRRDQMALVTGSPSDILVVQGGPGTGKSAVGLHRVTWLVNNGHFTAQDILVVGPHQQFLDYVSQVLPTLGTRNVNAVQVTRLWDGEILGADTPRARMVKSDERMAAVLRRRVEIECRPEAVDAFTTTPSYDGAKPELTVTVGSTTLRVPRSEVLALLEDVRQGDGSYRERRDRFRGLLVDRLLRELVAVAPRRGRDDTIRRDLERNRQVERLIERVWPSPGAREALRTLYDSEALLRTCSEGILDTAEQAAVHRPRADRADADPWTLDDHVCLEELRYLITGETPQRYGHIVVDEAQDLTPMQARALRRRSAAHGSMTILGDLAQATGPHSHTDWDRLGTLLSDHGDWRVAELNTSYRVPAEIMEFVAPLARTVAPTLPYPQAVRAVGEDAVRTVATEPWKLLDDTVAEATRLIGTSDGHTLRSVAVIVPDDSGWFDEISRHLDLADGITQQGREAVSVLAAAQAKGMEYDHVLVVEPATIADRGPAGLRQLYVALTRSTQSLTVLHTSPLPEALTNTDGSSTEPAPTEGEPGMADGDVPDIGTDVRVRVTGRAPGGRYRVKALSPAIDVPLVLTVRHGSVPPRPGAVLDCWVFAHETNHCLLTADQRGRQPISPTMADRYLAALGVLDDLTNADGTIPENARDRLSELKGMANRVLRRDQADWVDVRRVLGSPDKHRLSLLRDLAAHTNRMLKDNNLDVNRLQEELARVGWAQALDEAREELQHRRAASGEPETDHAPASAEQQSEQKEAEPVTSAEDMPATPEPAKGLLHSLETAAAADRTCKKHEAVRHALKAALLWADLQPTDSPVIDVSRIAEDGHFLYEVLGAGRSTYADLRSGATRLLEINHTLPAPADRLYLVLSEPPAEDWSAATLHGVFGVHVLWRTPVNWGGQDAETALSSGQA
ncbi:AAA family ATPase [Streptomyces europaeiscabiei]|uniref:HelD family protein n=1 Tax=Streptomyces europaeiscabiei TaxID=146819 RepID=UPI0029BE56F2|nr:AAA family ATPase [Streptomyces europaeiscabiei]MDX3693155.1 AAA family ATPase [Streptomyces europaeiscabiei]